MKRFPLVLIKTAAVALVLTLGLFSSAQSQRVRLALDWVPNTNHTGVFVAIAKGWYQEEGVDLQLLPFGNVTTDVLVASGRADVGILGTQGVLASHALDQPVISIGAIIASNTAALAVLEDSGIDSPAELDGKVYASFGGPVEQPLIESVIRHAGGEGEFESALLSLAGFEALLSGRADFVWIYEGWQAVQAAREGIDLRLFNFVDYGIADHYNPVFIASPSGVSERQEALSAFMRATSRGYTFASENPDEAARLLIETAPAGSFADEGLVYDSQEYVSQAYTDQGLSWGVQVKEKWAGFANFLLGAGVFSDSAGNPVSELDIAALYTNELLPEASGTAQVQAP